MPAASRYRARQTPSARCLIDAIVGILLRLASLMKVLDLGADAADGGLLVFVPRSSGGIMSYIIASRVCRSSELIATSNAATRAGKDGFGRKAWVAEGRGSGRSARTIYAGALLARESVVRHEPFGSSRTLQGMDDADVSDWVRVRSGDPAALGAVFDRHEARLFRQACRLLTSREDAKDAVTIAFFGTVARTRLGAARGRITPALAVERGVARRGTSSGRAADTGR